MKLRAGSLGLIFILCAAWVSQSLADGGVKIRVNDPNLAREIIAGGGRLVADYGKFQLLHADAATAEALRGRDGVEVRDGDRHIHLNVGDLDTTTPVAAAARVPVDRRAGKRPHLIHFAGPVHPSWYEALVGTGVTVVTHLPSNAYLVYGDGASLARLQALNLPKGVVQWDGAFEGAYKVHPNARAHSEDDLFAIQLVADPAANPATVQMINGLALEPIRKQSQVLNYVNIIVRIPANRVDDIAAQPDVVSIHRYSVPKKNDERQGQIVAGNVTGSELTAAGYLAWVLSKGFTQAQFTASGFAVDVTDSGIDNATAAPNHPGLYESGNSAGASRVIYNRLQGNPNSGSTLQGCDGHGNLNAHIIGGFNDLTGFPHADSSGFRYGLGIAPFVRLGSSVIFDPNNYTFPDFEDLQSRAYNSGARISSNSWGADTRGSYNLDSQRYDALVRDAQPTGSAVPEAGNQQMVIVFAAGNAGSRARTVGAPGTAKNVITVGASENSHSHSTANGGNSTTGNDGCLIPDTSANSLNDIISFSSRGPTSDGRKKPDLVAPGTHVTGGVAQAVSPGVNGTALSCFVATGVCALSGGGTAGDPDNFFPLGQQFYTTSSGTSHSTPAVAGGAAMVRQFFINQGSTPPGPAMTKAYLMNSVRYLTGVSANDTLWSNSQGMGLMDLGFAFDGTPRILNDEVAADMFTATGQSRTVTGTVSDTSRPFRVTLVWTDAPGSTVGNAFRNDLDLTVTVGGNTYKGNVFSGASSITGGSADTRNNVESVFLPAGTTGPFTVTVTAANINSDGVPNNASSLDQDFALVIYNATTAAATPTLSIGNATMTEGNAGTVNAVFTATLSAASTQTVTAQFATADGTATAGSDYVTAVGTLTFNAGETSKTVTVLVNGDTQVEPDETFFVNLSAPTNATIAAGQGVGTILNDDVAPLPTLSIGNATVTEGNAGTVVNAVFTINLSTASTQTVTVNFATANGTATAGSDYQVIGGTLTFNAGETSKTIVVRVRGDTIVEPNETFFVNLSVPTNATIAAGQGVGTILNDD